MNKENNSAASLRRSAIAERIRLREEWSELKGITESSPLSQSNRRKETDSSKFPKPSKPVRPFKSTSKTSKTVTRCHKAMSSRSDVLSGIVVLVDVGVESRALPLRAALSALGATVVPVWSPIVTHLVWAQDGCRSTRANARAMACQLVSPLWVEACVASNSRLPERTFSAVMRPSDLPSPRTLRQLLKKAEMENIPLANLLADKEEEKETREMRLRISSETENDSSKDTSKDTSKDKSKNTCKSTTMDTSGDTSPDTSDVESRVNTAPRRAMPISITPPAKSPAKSRRKLFNQREEDLTKTTAGESDADSTAQKRVGIKKPSMRVRKELLRAERLARRLATTAREPKAAPAASKTPRIVLTGMCSKERQSIAQAIRELNGRIQKRVNRKTTHVVLGACCEAAAACCDAGNTSLRSRFNITGVTQLTSANASANPRARTLSALLGVARGCHVVRAEWVRASQRARAWLRATHRVPHLARAATKARIERSALGQTGAEYAYDVFNSLHVHVAPSANQREAAIELLKLCGASVQDGGLTQNGGCDVTIGDGEGQVASKWVFDSVASARLRTKRRYVNHPLDNIQDTSR